MSPGGFTMRTALSMSQSLKMMRGDFPPSSKETFFTLLTAQLWTGDKDARRVNITALLLSRRLSSTHLFMMCFPISVEPVKPSLRTSGWSDRRWPTKAPTRTGDMGGWDGRHGPLGQESVFLPDPGRMLTTPFGSPALAANSANFSAVSGVTWKKTTQRYLAWLGLFPTGIKKSILITLTYIWQHVGTDVT